MRPRVQHLQLRLCEPWRKDNVQVRFSSVTPLLVCLLLSSCFHRLNSSFQHDARHAFASIAVPTGAAACTRIGSRRMMRISSAAHTLSSFCVPRCRVCEIRIRSWMLYDIGAVGVCDVPRIDTQASAPTTMTMSLCLYDKARRNTGKQRLISDRRRIRVAAEIELQ